MRRLVYAIVVLILAGLVIGSMADPVTAGDEATNLGPVVNSPDSDFGPIISADGNALYFTSDRAGGSGGQDIWVSRKVNGAWGPPQNLGNKINTSYNEGPDTLAVDETVLYFTRCDQVKDPGTCDIYTANWDEGRQQWTGVKNMGAKINSRFNDANASISHDGNRLYFVSDRPSRDKKRKNWDIFMASREPGGNFGTAQRMGAPVNTEGDEFHVMIHQNDKLLFFCSNGHGGFGESDIFVSKIENGAYSKPRNLGPPINTPDNDMYFTVAASLDLAYLASDRSDTVGVEDIYVVPFDIDLPEQGVIIVKGIIADRTTCSPPGTDPATGIKVYDIKTCTPINGAVIRMAEVVSDRVIKQDSTGPSGAYKVVIPSGNDYAISATARGYSFHTERFNVAATQPFEVIEKNILLDPHGAGPFVVNNLYFDFDKSTLRPESKNELNNAIRWLKENPELRIEIGGHTDSKGSDSYNIRLSQARAKSVYDYLIRNGQISPARLVASGYGERMPIASNATDEGRQLNRRVEFKILP